MRLERKKGKPARPGATGRLVYTLNHVSSGSRRVLLNAGPLLMESLHCENAQSNKDRHNDELRNFEGCLGLCRRQHSEARYLFKELYNEDENIQVEGKGGANHISPAPASSEMAAVARENRNSQHYQRYDTDHSDRRDPVGGRSESCNARCRRGCEE